MPRRKSTSTRNPPKPHRGQNEQTDTAMLAESRGFELEAEDPKHPQHPHPQQIDSKRAAPLSGFRQFRSANCFFASSDRRPGRQSSDHRRSLPRYGVVATSDDDFARPQSGNRNHLILFDLCRDLWRGLSRCSTTSKYLETRCFGCLARGNLPHRNGRSGSGLGARLSGSAKCIFIAGHLGFLILIQSRDVPGSVCRRRPWEARPDPICMILFGI